MIPQEVRKWTLLYIDGQTYQLTTAICQQNGQRTNHYLWLEEDVR
jgi:hypothetical protein